MEEKGKESKMLGVMIPKELHTKIKMKALKEELSLTDFILKLLRDNFDKPKKERK